MKYVISVVPVKDKLKLISVFYEDDKYTLKSNEFFLTEEIFNKVIRTIQIPETEIYVIVPGTNQNIIENLDSLEIIKKKYVPVTFKYLASYFDTENFRVLGGLNVIESTNDYERKCYMEISEEVYKYLKENILFMNSGQVKVSKELNEIKSVSDIKCGISELNDSDKFELEKSMVIHKTYSSLFSRLDEKTIYDFFNFTIKNNELISEGVIITNENRDEEYLKILKEANSDDQDVKEKAEKRINILSDYLESMDSLYDHFSTFKVFNEFKDNVYDAETEDDLKKVIEKYDRKFFGSK